MPLPFIPIILGGLAAATAAVGVKKGYDAIQDSGEAQRLNRRAEDVFEESQKSLDNQRKKNKQ